MIELSRKTLLPLVIACFSCLLICSNASAQWVEIGQGQPPDVVCLGSSDSTLFAGTKVHGAFRLPAGDSVWVASDSGMLGATNVHAFAANGGDVYAATTCGVFHSIDTGRSWSVGNPIPNSDVRSLLIVDTELFAGTAYGVFRSRDKAKNWTPVNFGLTDPTVYAFALMRGRLFAGTYAGVFALKLGDTTWTSVNDSQLHQRYVRDFATTGDTLVAATDSGVFISIDNARTWRNSGDVLTSVRSIASSGSTLFAGTNNGGLYESFDLGRTWKWASRGLQESTIWSTIVWGDKVVIGKNDNNRNVQSRAIVGFSWCTPRTHECWIGYKPMTN